MSRFYGDWIIVDVISKGSDSDGDFEIIRTHGKRYCNCHPETCCHFDGITYVDYLEKVYLPNKSTIQHNKDKK